MTLPSTKTPLRIHLFGRHFTPKLLPSLFLLLLGPVFCTLGIWQYHRALAKEQMLQQFAQAKMTGPVSIQDTSTPPPPEYYPVKVQGKLDQAHQLLVENKFHQHHLGFEVITPLRLEDGTTLLLNRGWIAKDQVNTLPSTMTTLAIDGILYTPAKTIFQVGQAQISTQWPKRIQNLSWREIHRVALADWTLRPYIVVLTESSAHRFTPIFQPTILPPAKHYGYAVQWFAMALALLMIWLVMGFYPQSTEFSARD